MASAKQSIEQYTIIALLILLTLDVSVHFLLRQDVPIAKQQTSKPKTQRTADGEASTQEQTQKGDQFKEKFDEFKNKAATGSQNDEDQEAFSSQKKRTTQPQDNLTDNDDQIEAESRSRRKNKKNKRRSLEVKVLHCSSGSFKSKFDQIQQTLVSSDEFPGIEVYALDYPNSPLNELVMKGLTYAQYGMIILNFFGDKIFGYLKMDYPRWYLLLKEKKMIAIFGVYMGGNLLKTQLQSGAFEIYADNQLIYSKLQTQALPNVGQIIRLVEQQYEK